MKKRIGELLIKIGAIWNIITGGITLFYYSSWMEENILKETATTTGGLLADRYYFQSVYLFVIGYGLFFILVGAINYYLASKVKDSMMSRKMLVWLAIWSLASYLTVDIIGFVLYFAAIIISLMKNIAVKARNSQTI